MESDLYKRGYSPLEIVKAGFGLFRDNAAAIILITLLTSIPISVLNAAANEVYALDWMGDPAFTSEEYSGLLWENLGAALMSLITLISISAALYFVSLLSTMALALYLKSCIDGKKIDFQEAYARAFGKWPQAVWTSIVQGILLCLLFLLFIIPAFIYLIYWSFAIYAVALRGVSGKEALDHSKNLVKGRWWNMLGYTILFSVIGFVIAFPFFIVLGILHWSMDDAMASLALDAVGNILYSVTGSVTAVMQILLFLNYDATVSTFKREY